MSSMEGSILHPAEHTSSQGMFESKKQEAVFRGYLDSVHGPALFYARFYSKGDPALAKDFFQTASLNAAKGFSSYRPEAPFLNWFLQILHRVAIDWHRQQDRRAELYPAGSPDYYAASMDESPEDTFRKERRKQLIENAFQQLPTDRQELLRDAYMEGLTMAEIAAKYGLTVENVKMRLHRAKKILAEILREIPEIAEEFSE